MNKAIMNKAIMKSPARLQLCCSLAGLFIIGQCLIHVLVEILSDGIREPVSGSLLYGNNIISGAVVPTSNAIGMHYTRVYP
jgi:hypothetical protein